MQSSLALQDQVRGSAPQALGSEGARSLTSRVQSMAHRWGYSTGELAEVLKLARQDPKRWLAAIELDEQREAEFRAAGVNQ